MDDENDPPFWSGVAGTGMYYTVNQLKLEAITCN